MATDLRDAKGVAVTAEEAEAIFELWAKRQADTEALRSRLTVQDMAEAMSIPPSDVERMLISVRAGRAQPQIQGPATKVRPINSFLISMAAVAWIAILLLACFIAYRSGWRNRGYEQPPAPFLNTPLPDVALPPQEVPSAIPFVTPETDLVDLGRLFSTNLTIEFDKASIEGQGVPGQQGPLRTDVLLQVVDAISPAPSVDIPTQLTGAQLVKALRNGQAQPVEDIIQFKELVLRTNNGGAPLKEMIPVALTQNAEIAQLVREEQLRRLKILANTAGQKLDL
jgi:hypothetical protein